jgi:hypothetical protein
MASGKSSSSTTERAAFAKKKPRLNKQKSTVHRKRSAENIKRIEEKRLYYLKIKETKRTEYLNNTSYKCRTAKHQYYQEGTAKRAKTGDETASSADQQGTSNFSIPVKISSCVDSTKSIDQGTAILSDEPGGQSGFHRALVCIVLRQIHHWYGACIWHYIRETEETHLLTAGWKEG